MLKGWQANSSQLAPAPQMQVWLEKALTIAVWRVVAVWDGRLPQEAVNLVVVGEIPLIRTRLWLLPERWLPHCQRFDVWRLMSASNLPEALIIQG